MMFMLNHPTFDGRNLAPVDIGSVSHHLQGFNTSLVVVWLFYVPSTCSITLALASTGLNLS